MLTGQVDNLTEDERLVIAKAWQCHGACALRHAQNRLRYDLNPGWNEMQASLAAVFREAPWTLRRGLHVRKEESAAGAAAFSLYIGEALSAALRWPTCAALR